MSYTKSIADKGQVETSPATGYVVDLLTLAETLNYLRQDYGVLVVEDTLVKDLIKASRQWIENYIGRSIIKKTITAFTPDEVEYFRLPFPPVVTITSVSRVAADGTKTALTANMDYYAIGTDEKIICSYPIWSTVNSMVCGIEVVYDAYMSEIPAPLKEACLQLVAHSYFNRGNDVPMPVGIIDRLRPFRIV